MYYCIINIQHISTTHIYNINTKNSMRLKANVLTKIKRNKELRRALIKLHDNSETTILLWLRTNSTKLIEYPSLLIIANHLKTDIDDLITETDEVFNQGVK